MLTFDKIEVQISHASSDDDITLENATMYDAQRTACDRIIETWDEHNAENAGTDGYPAFGVTIEAYNLYDANTDYCFANSDDFHDSFLEAESDVLYECVAWKQEDGLPYPPCPED